MFDNAVPQDLDFSVEPPTSADVFHADGVFVRHITIPKAGTLVPQHSHTYDHTTMLAVGSMRVWVDGKMLGDFIAPRPIFIAAKALHTFQALTDGVVFFCIHNTSRTGEVQEHEKHELPGSPCNTCSNRCG